ncbi:hypothetical protein [Streptomyces sp. NPDC088246]|uniref:hypothetical protein n=1 Tax=Streptomyces sp. NPDC088246 TaxID=3365842 RepID=UPI00380442D0
MDSEITTTVGRQLYSFDGRVLEVFGGNAVRFHVRHMHLCVKGPDRKGARIVEICHGRPEAPGVRHMWKYSAVEWDDLPGLARLLDVVQAAIDSAAER